MRVRQQPTDFWRGVVLAMATLVLTMPLTAQEMEAVALLKKMSSQIEGLDAFVLEGDAYADARLREGQIIQHTLQLTMRVDRPGSLRFTNRSADGTKELYLSDGTLTVSSQPQNLYAQTEIPNGIASAVTFAMDELDIDTPLMDLLMANVAENLTEDARNVRYLGKSLVREKLYHHIGLRGPETDVQVWIAVDGPALPGKIVMSSKWEGGSPRYVAFLEWDTTPNLPNGTFEFEPPEGAMKIEFLRTSQGQ
jgi:hypothetical protein